jgi:hypothetical protein
MKPSPVLRAVVKRVLFNAGMQRVYGEAPRVGPEVWSILKREADTARRQFAAHNPKVRK